MSWMLFAIACMDPGPAATVPSTPAPAAPEADDDRGIELPTSDTQDVPLTDSGGILVAPTGVISTCKAWLDADPSATTGIYALQPDPYDPITYDVLCDMDTDEGGWTLVASTRDTPLDDKGGEYHTGLTTDEPTVSADYVWRGLRRAITGNSDIRFACRVGAVLTVDLSFYDVPWYRTITTGTDDASSCFVAGGNNISPGRRNNILGTTRAVGNEYNSGEMEGEDSCADTSDFTVDFDDRGMDSDQSDGSDWGEDDSAAKCGTSGLGDAWMIYVREPA